MRELLVDVGDGDEHKALKEELLFADCYLGAGTHAMKTQYLAESSANVLLLKLWFPNGQRCALDDFLNAGAQKITMNQFLRCTTFLATSGKDMECIAHVPTKLLVMDYAKMALVADGQSVDLGKFVGKMLLEIDAVKLGLVCEIAQVVQSDVACLNEETADAAKVLYKVVGAIARRSEEGSALSALHAFMAARQQRKQQSSPKAQQDAAVMAGEATVRHNGQEEVRADETAGQLDI